MIRGRSGSPNAQRMLGYEQVICQIAKTVGHFPFTHFVLLLGTASFLPFLDDIVIYRDKLLVLQPVLLFVH